MKKIQLMIFAFAGMLIFAASCSVDDSNTNPDQGGFLLVNASPDAPGLNVNINGSPFGSGLMYGMYTPYYFVTAGSYQFAFYGSATTPVLTTTENINVSKNYSYFVIDSFSKIKSSFVEDNLIIPSVDSVYLRFFNFSPDAGALSLYDSASSANWFGTRTFNDEESDPAKANFTRLKSGIFTLQLRQPDGTVLTSRIDTLSGGHVYTIFAKGFAAGTGTQAIGFGHIVHF